MHVLKLIELYTQKKKKKEFYYVYILKILARILREGKWPQAFGPCMASVESPSKAGALSSEVSAPFKCGVHLLP